MCTYLTMKYVICFWAQAMKATGNVLWFCLASKAGGKWGVGGWGEAKDVKKLRWHLCCYIRWLLSCGFSLINFCSHKGVNQDIWWMEIVWLGSGFWEDDHIIKKKKAWLQNKRSKKMSKEWGWGMACALRVRIVRTNLAKNRKNIVRITLLEKEN